MKTIQLNSSDYWDWASAPPENTSRIINGMTVYEANRSYTIMRNNKRVPTWVNLRFGEPDDYWGYIDEEGQEWKVEWIEMITA